MMTGEYPVQKPTVAFIIAVLLILNALSDILRFVNKSYHPLDRDGWAISLVISIAFGIAGVELFWAKGWARTLILISSTLAIAHGAFFSASYLIQAVHYGNIHDYTVIPIVGSFILMTLFPALFLIYFSRPSIKELFK